MFLNVGFGNYVSIKRVLTITASDTAPAKRLSQETKKRGMYIDATQGRKTRTILVMDSGHVVGSANTPETIAGRV